LFAGVFIILFAVAEVVYRVGREGQPLLRLGWPPVPFTVAMPLGNSNPTAAYSILVIPVALAGSMTMPQRDLRWGLRGLAVGLIVVVLLTQSRGAYMGLAVMAGLTTLLWLLRPATRARFPAALRPLLAPRLLVSAAIVVVMGAVVLILAFMVYADGHGSIVRLDLWVAGAEMVSEHPFTGVGPRQYAGERLWHVHWFRTHRHLAIQHAHRFRTHRHLAIQHAHSLPFHWLAEGGGLVLVMTLWLLDQLRRTWWRGWRAGNAPRRRRLEGALLALLAFATHSLVDTFLQAAFATHSLVDTFLQAQLMTPLLIIGAYIVASDTAFHGVNIPHKTPRRRRALVGAVLVGVVAAQIAFIPLHRGLLAHQRALAALEDDDLSTALSAARDAQEADPWNDLYRLQEAIILGELANDDPEIYLQDAIRAFEDGLSSDPKWDLGWHNLAALYAQAGRIDEAVAAEREAAELYSLAAEYHFKLGEYYLLAGDTSAAQHAFVEALKRRAGLASLRFWSDPAHPERLPVLEAAIDEIADDKPLVALDLAVYAGDYETALAIIALEESAVVQGEELRDEDLRIRLDALWPESRSDDPCWRCYVLAITVPKAVRDDLVRAEWLLTHHDNPLREDLRAEAEKAARRATRLSPNGGSWGWYVLARLEATNDGDPDTINRWLDAAVHYPKERWPSYSRTVYTLRAELHTLPQARVPVLGALAYEPWLRLAERHEAAGAWDDARAIYERILASDPHAGDIRARLDALPPPAAP